MRNDRLLILQKIALFDDSELRKPGTKKSALPKVEVTPDGRQARPFFENLQSINMPGN